jgi:hypothetical protein
MERQQRETSTLLVGDLFACRRPQLTILCVTHLDKVRFEVARYEHQLLVFDVHESSTGTPDLVIGLKSPVEGVGCYIAPVHPRDIDHPQFAWTFQRYLYDCIHDYMAELFTRNPQELERRQ